MPDDMRTQAAAYVDAEFSRAQDDLFREHRRQEQRQLAWHNSARQSFARNRELSEQRYCSGLNPSRRGGTASPNACNASTGA